MRLVFTRSNSPMGKMIRRTSWHFYSHVALTDGADVWESVSFKGTIKTPYAKWLVDHADDDVEEMEVPLDDEAKVIEYLDSQVGSEYDYFELLGHVFHWDIGDRRRFTCSSLVIEAINENNKFISHKKYYRVQPRHIWNTVRAFNNGVIYGATTMVS